MEPFIGQVIIFGGNFAPRGWAFCDGQLLPIAQNTALFSLLGTTYGGDGRTTFALPDLRGRAAVHPGNGPGLSSRRLGEKGGAENTTIGINNMPGHNHTAEVTGTVKQPVSGNAGNTDSPTDGFPATAASDVYTDTPSVGEFGGALTPDLTITVNDNGGGQSFNNMPPFECVNYIIALTGVFPSRS